MSVAAETMTFDTSLSPVMFANASDRRDAPRVPFEQGIRVGPAYGAPYATVSAENLSSGGIFIRSDKPAEPGARFSVELSLPNYGRLYIPEAHVLYNRNDNEPGDSGFGAHFTGLTEEVENVLRSVAVFPTAITEPNGGEVSESMICARNTWLPSGGPQPVRHSRIARDEQETPIYQKAIRAAQVPPLCVSDLTLSFPPEPELDLSISPHIAANENTDVVRVRAKKPHRARKTSDGFMAMEWPRFAKQDLVRSLSWGLGLGSAVAFLLGIGLTLGNAESPREVSPAELVAQSGVSSQTHENLVAQQASIIGLSASPVSKSLPVKPSGKQKPLVRASVVLPPVAHAKAIKKQAALKTKKLLETAKTRPSKLTSPSLKNTGAASLLALSKSTEQTLAIGVSVNASVLRSYALKSPSRLVVDLVGQDGALKIPELAGFVTGIRTGEHPGYTRIVIDSAQALKDSQVEVDGADLKIRLER
jgi:hypothetical protein